MPTVPTYNLFLSSVDALRDAWQKTLKHSAAYVSCNSSPAVLSRVKILFELPEKTQITVPGQVISLDAAGFFVQLDKGHDQDALRSAADYVLNTTDEAHAQPPDPPESEDENPEEITDEKKPVEAGGNPGVSKPAWELIDNSSDVPLHKQVANLSTAEKLKLARHATLPVRRLLIRDNEKRIHVAIVKNTQITDTEIVEYSGIKTISPGVLRWLATQKKYLRNRQVVTNIIYNPMTPTDTAMKLLGRLTQSELLKLSRSSRVKQALQRIAKKTLMDRGVI